MTQGGPRDLLDVYTAFTVQLEVKTRLRSYLFCPFDTEGGGGGLKRRTKGVLCSIFMIPRRFKEIRGLSFQNLIPTMTTGHVSVSNEYIKHYSTYEFTFSKPLYEWIDCYNMLKRRSVFRHILAIPYGPWHSRISN